MVDISGAYGKLKTWVKAQLHTDHQSAAAENAIFKSVNIVAGEAYKQDSKNLLEAKDTANIFIGESNGQLTTGDNNNFIGLGCGHANTSGYNNTFIGKHTGYKNTIGQRNTFIGYESGYNNTEGNQNMFIGNKAGYSNISNNQNLGIGIKTLYLNNAGTKLVAIGAEAGYSCTGSRSMFLGYKSGYYETGNDKLYINNSNAVTPLIWGDFANNKIGIRLKPVVSTFGVANIPTYADDGTAGTAGLVAGEFYKHADGSLHIKL